jgi:trehalose synthase
VVASAVGGIQDQITDGQDGLLLRDPTDLAGLGVALGRLLRDPGEAAALGSAGYARVHDRLLGDRHLEAYVELFRWLLR